MNYERILETMEPTLLKVTESVLLKSMIPSDKELYREQAEQMRELGKMESDKFSELSNMLKERDMQMTQQQPRQIQPVQQQPVQQPTYQPAPQQQYTGETFSSDDQDDEGYCMECILGHMSSAMGMLEEAQRLSQGEDKLNQESIKRVKVALAELKSSLYDLGAVSGDWIEEFKQGVRRVRKQYLTPALANPSRKELVKQAYEEVDQLYDKAIEIVQEVEEQVEEKKEEIEEESTPTLDDYSDAEGEEMDLIIHLENYKDSNDPEHIKKAVDMSESLDCKSCRKRLKKAYELAKQGERMKAKKIILGIMYYLSIE